MKLSEIKEILLGIHEDAEEVTLSFDFIKNAPTEIRVDWWITTEYGLDNLSNKEYTVREFNELVGELPVAYTFKDTIRYSLCPTCNRSTCIDGMEPGTIYYCSCNNPFRVGEINDCR